MRRVLVSVALFVAAILAMAGSAQGATGWTQPVKVWNGNYSNPSVVVDAHGHVFMAARGDTGIWLLTNKTGRWTRTRLTTDTTQGGQPVTGDDPTLVRDPWDGSLTVVYTRDYCCDTPSGSDVRYVTNRSGAWSAPATIPGVRMAQAVSVRHGVIAVASRTGDFDSTTVAFATNASGHWTRATIGSERIGGPDDPSLALDSHLRPVIAYVTSTMSGVVTIHLATGQTKTGDFKLTKIVTGSVNDPILALDAHDQPHVAYFHWGGITYASRGSSGWSFSRVTDITVNLAELRLDVQGHPRFLFARDNGLWYATKSASGWHEVHLDSRTLLNVPSLALGPGGKAYAAYACGGYSNARVWLTHAL